ncbi:helix-turn-helix domain-containing protein [Anaeromicropila populeti]|uniref:DNA-binding transcriptional regulator, XRE-family HTH domain n=1 Tax=Anaeromicropila populeti TaxID=37658 RepID=A0A1I6JGU0_9FIRM|nr:helix-turn-helix transcriptional regulator [Anaeromicropila populeti]SFR78203.1 DNA-binding transcriptional regulator, XRE-family HTH domain [Anaeromicropila populeti]
MKVYERIKQLRTSELNLTQEEFAKRINMSRSNLGSIEIGRVNVTERVFQDICFEFNVNENWLSKGEGHIFNYLSPDEELAAFMGKLISEDNNSAKKKFFIAFSKLPDELFIQLYKSFEEIFQHE